MYVGTPTTVRINFLILTLRNSFIKKDFKNTSHYSDFEIVNHHASYSQSAQELVSHYLLSFHTMLNDYHACIHDYAGKKAERNL